MKAFIALLRAFCAVRRFVRRAAVTFRMRSLETRLHDLNAALQMVRDDETYVRISMARAQVRRELVMARAEYVALLPAGERKTWAEA